MISVRHVKQSDHDQYIRVNRTLLNGRYFEPYGTIRFRLERTLDNANNLSQIQHYDIFLAYLDGRLAGYCLFMPRSKGIELFVVNRYRRRGIGSKLIEAVRGITKLSTLCAKPGFTGSDQFFLKHHVYVRGVSLNRQVERAMREIDPKAFNWDSTTDYVTLERKAVRRVKMQLHHKLRRATENVNQ